ncbi:hypothetical protein [Egicoccus sp. AB-alg6-2]|uniref:hypothetical protein n=1 Tax=Egicoccus sp. AB-alg6-2 TaxID=3242692 RepID=UPI00359E1877
MGTLFGGGELSPRRRWLAIIAASLVMQFAYWPIVTALGASHAGDPVPADLVAFGLALVPLTFLVLAFGSRHRGAPGAVLKAMGLFLLVGLPVVLLNPVVGLFAGFGAGGVVAQRRLGGVGLRTRIVTLVVASAYVLLLIAIGATDFAIVSAAALPLATTGIADEITLGRAAASGNDEAA